MKNAILITIDCLRYDFLDLDSRGKLKNLRKILKNSHFFTNVISCGPNTPSAFSSIFTSTYPLMYGGYSYLSGDRLTIAEVLEKKGFQTAGVHSNPHLLARYNFSKGFSRFFDYESVGNSPSPLQKLIGSFRRKAKETFKSGGMSRVIDSIADSPVLRKAAEFLRGGKTPYEGADIINDCVKGWAAGDLDRDKRFFLWLHYMEPHVPYVSRKDDAGVTKSKISDLMYRVRQQKEVSDQDRSLLKDLYLEQLEHLDHYLGQLLDYLDYERLLDETVLVVTADHGDAFFEHGYHGHAKTFGYDGCRLHQPVLRVPLLVYNKDLEARTYENRISQLGLGPTLLDLLDIKKPEGFLGNSAISGNAEEGTIISEYRNGMPDGKEYGFYSFITGGKKYIYDSYKNERKMFNLQADPGETKDIFPDDADHVKVLDGLLSEHEKMIRSTGKELPVQEADPKLKKRLEDLGYM